LQINATDDAEAVYIEYGSWNTRKNIFINSDLTSLGIELSYETDWNIQYDVIITNNTLYGMYCEDESIVTGFPLGAPYSSESTHQPSLLSLIAYW